MESGARPALRTAPRYHTCLPCAGGRTGTCGVGLIHRSHAARCLLAERVSQAGWSADEGEVGVH